MTGHDFTIMNDVIGETTLWANNDEARKSRAWEAHRSRAFFPKGPCPALAPVKFESCLAWLGRLRRKSV